MNRRDFLKKSAAAVAALAIPGCTQHLKTSAGRRPNFIFILVDDLGFKDLGCYGSTFYETPNIDLLARQSMRFTDAYAAAPVCSPTRASILTGKYPARLYLTNYLIGKRRGKLIQARYIHHLPLEEITIAEALKSAGYTSASIGKWHLGPQPFFPQHQGFDLNFGGSDSGMPADYFYPRWKDNPPIEAKSGQYLPDVLSDRAIRFIEQNKSNPFFIYLSFYSVHIPLQGKQHIIDKYHKKARQTPPPTGPRFKPEGKYMTRQIQDNPTYAAMVQSVDENVGRILKKLDRLNLDDNTVIIFFSDNGGLATAQGYPTSNNPLRAGKGWLYEGGIREPLIIKWPGQTKPDSFCCEPVTSTDFYPTILEMANLPSLPAQHTDGRSLVTLLKGKSTLNRDAIFWHYPHYGGQGGTPAAAVRAGDFKLIEFYEDNRIELYNLKEDIAEQFDLAQKMPQKALQLRNILRNWQKSVDAKMPTPNFRYTDSP